MSLHLLDNKTKQLTTVTSTQLLKADIEPQMFKQRKFELKTQNLEWSEMRIYLEWNAFSSNQRACRIAAR